MPVGIWGPPGTEAAQAYGFRDTAKMVEFFSERYGYAYPWAKYDQISLHEFEGAMETTTMVGFGESYARLAGDPPDGHPDFDHAYPTWTAQDTISHELAHHWFGDLLTCRSLGSLWLNESFATFSHTLWNGHANGEDDLTYQRWRYLNAYLDYVRKSGTVRPMEYLRYAAPGDMYQEETTYLKGSLVLHMLRHFVGDADFFRTLGDYLRDSRSRQRRLGRSEGSVPAVGGAQPVVVLRRLDHGRRRAPVVRRLLRLVSRAAADRPDRQAGPGRPPLRERVPAAGRRGGRDDGGRANPHRRSSRGGRRACPCPRIRNPSRWSSTRGTGSWPRSGSSALSRSACTCSSTATSADRLRAIRQVVQEHARRPEAVAALARLLADAKAHWGVRQEAAVGLGTIGGEAATTALLTAAKDADARVRRAAATGLASSGGPRARGRPARARPGGRGRRRRRHGGPRPRTAARRRRPRVPEGAARPRFALVGGDPYGRREGARRARGPVARLRLRHVPGSPLPATAPRGGPRRLVPRRTGRPRPRGPPPRADRGPQPGASARPR